MIAVFLQSVVFFMHKLMFTSIITWWLWKRNNSDLVPRWLCVYDSQTLGQPLEVGGQKIRWHHYCCRLERGYNAASKLCL